MAEPRSTDTELILLLTLLRDFPDDEPYLEDLLHRLFRRLHRNERWDPELEELLVRAFRHRRRPRHLEDAREVATAVLDGFRRSFREDFIERIEKLSVEVATLGDSTAKRFEELSGEAAKLREAQQEQASRLGSEHAQVIETRETLHDFVWLLSTGTDVRNVATQRYVPVRVYVTDPVPSEAQRSKLLDALFEFFASRGFERSYDLPDESGSWWKKLFLRTKDAATHEQVQKRLRKAERALQNEYLEKPQAEANQMQANAASSLIEALKDTPTACIQVGSLLLVKGPGPDGRPAIIARTLTTTELQALEENQAMLRQPEQVLQWLEGCTNPKGRLTQV